MKLLWDAFIIVLALIIPIMNSICVSLDPPFRYTAGFPAVNLIVNIIFIFDMALIFRTSRLDFMSGQETQEPRQLALIYIKSYRFWIDVLSVIPFEMFYPGDMLILFSMLKIFRIGRFNKIVYNTNLNSHSKIVSQLFIDFLKLTVLYIVFETNIHVHAAHIVSPFSGMLDLLHLQYE